MAPPKISDKEIIEIQSLYDKGFNIPQIQEKTGKSSSVIDRYIKADRIKPKIPAVPQTEEPKTETKTEPARDEPKHVKLEPAQPEPQEALPPLYPETPEPAEWLRGFLEGYRLKPQFVQGQYSRVKRRNTLPTPQDLMSDLQVGDSGQKNILMIRDIVEDYDFAVEEFMKQRDQIMHIPATRRRGIPLDRGQPQPMDYTRGIPVRTPPAQYDQYGQPYQQYGRQPDRCDVYGRPYNDRREGIPLQPMQGNPMYPQSLQQQLRDFVEIDRLIHGTQQATPDPKMEMMSNELDEMRRERRADKEREINQMREQMQRDHVEKQQLSQAIRQYEDKLRETDLKLQFEQSNKRTTEQDVEMKKADHDYNLGIKKLDEGGKTREAIANAVKTGFSQVGQAIFATAQELGSEEKRPMQGVTDTKNMWQSECPFCQTPITAPLSARMLTCPGCARQLEVTPPTPERQIERPPPRETATFTVEQPPLPPLEQQPLEQPTPPERPPKDEAAPRLSECPFCKTPLTIPAGLDIVECPQCKKRLKVEVEAPTSGVHIEVPKEIYMESPPPPEITEPIKEPETMEHFPKEKKAPIEEKFTPEEKEQIDKSIEDAKKGRSSPLEIKEEPRPEPEIQKIAEGLAIGEGVKKVEEELKKEKEPAIFSKDGYKLYVTKAGKNNQPFYYFAKQSEKGKPCTEIPDGYEIGKNQRSGVPNLKKKKGDKK